MKIWLLLGLIAMLTAAHLQQDGLWLAEARGAFRAEATAESLSLQADAASIHSATAWLESEWADTRAALKELRADMNAEAQRYGEALKRRICSFKGSDIERSDTASRASL